ncbi:MAG: LamG domain-containing protein [Pirellulaceae bacterium]
MTYLNTIFADNTGSDNIVSGNTGTGAGAEAISLGYNISDDQSGNLTAAGDLDGVDPMLGPLGLYGGTTPVHPLMPSSPALDAGLVGYRQAVGSTLFSFLYPMNDDVETNPVVDNSQFASTYADGLAMGDVTRADGAPINGETHNAIRFNGNDAYVSIPYHPNLNPTNFTIEAWAKVEGGDGTYRTLIMSRSNGAAEDAAGFNIYAASNNRWEFWTGNGAETTGTGGEWDVLQGPAIVNNEWTHLVATFQYESTSANGVLVGTKSLYVNGELVAAGSGRHYVPNTTAPLYFGAGGTESNEAALFFNGVIDEVGIDSSALTAAHVKRHFVAAAKIDNDPRGFPRDAASPDVGAFQGTIDMIGVNFVGGRDGFAGSAIAGVAGVTPQANGNNVADNAASASGAAKTGSHADLIDARGQTTATDISWVANNTYTVSTLTPPMRTAN